eukprot:5469422-Pyramimonas_sp.AAC.1
MGVPGAALGVLAFFFQIPHIDSATASGSGANLFTLNEALGFTSNFTAEELNLKIIYIKTASEVCNGKAVVCVRNVRKKQLAKCASETRGPKFGSPPCFFDGQAFKSIVMNFRKDENTIAENCLMAFERNRLAMFNRAISTAGTSAVSNQSQQNSGGTDQEDRGSMDIERVTSIEDRTRVLRRKHFATLMVRLLTAVQKGSK